jgi:hypothetical protein
MSVLGANMSSFAYWNLARRPDMSNFSYKLDWEEFFDDLHFNNSPNAFPLIVQSSEETNKIKTPNYSKILATVSLFLHCRPYKF